MRSTSNVPSLLNFLNDEQIPSLKNASKRFKTNGSFISSYSDNSKIRIGTLNKDYSFVNLNKQTIELKEQQEQQQQDGTKMVIPSMRQQILQDPSKQAYLNWVKNTRNLIAQNMGRNKLSQYERQKIKQLLQKQNHNYFMLQISGISDIYWHNIQNAYQKTHPQNDLYCRMVISLIQQDDQSGSRIFTHPKKIVTEMTRLQRREKKDNNNNNRTQQLRQSNFHYVTDQKFSVYFHSNKQFIYVQVDVILYEVKRHEFQEKEGDEDQINTQAQVVVHEQCFGSVLIPAMQKNNNTSQYIPRQSSMNSNINIKKQLKRYNAINFNTTLNFIDQIIQANNKQQKDFNNYGVIHYKLVNSKYYHLLQKFIPTEYLVTYQDLIPGILGTHLPKVDDMLFQLTPSTQAKSLYLELQTLQIQTQWIHTAKQKAKLILQRKNLHNFVQNNNNLHIDFDKLNLSLILHNGIVEVSRMSCQLFQIMEIQKRFSNSTQRNISQKQIQSQRNNNFIQIKIFSSSLLSLPVIFCEPNIFIVLQIQQKVHLKYHDQSTNLNVSQQILIPVGFTFFDPLKITSNKPIQTRFYKGWYLDEKLYSIQSKQRQRGIVLQSINNLFFSRSKIEISRQRLFPKQQAFSKISLTFSFKQPQYDLFWSDDKTKTQQNQNKNYPALSNRSLLTNNQHAKIQAQKQKFLKKVANSFNQPKQAKRQVTKKMKVRDQIVLVQNPQSLYINTNVKLSQQTQKRQISELKSFLKVLKNLQDQSQRGKNINEQQESLINKMDKLKSDVRNELHMKKLFKYVYEKDQKQLGDYFVSYRELLGKKGIKVSLLSQLIHTWYPSSLYKILSSKRQQKILNLNQFPRSGENISSFMMLENRENLQDYSYEKTPIEVLRTQLTEINYNYLILINPLSIKPIQKSNQSFFALPHTFFIKIYFWNMQSQTSPCFQIDPSNGEIYVLQNQQKNQPLKNVPKSSTNQTSNFKKSIEKNAVSKHNKNITKRNEQKSRFDQNLMKKQSDSHKLKLKKVFHFQYGCQQGFANKNQLYLDFIDYLYNGLMQIRLYDQFQEIGKTFFRLRNLIRKRKNQASSVIEEPIYSKYGPICTLKIECKSLRKQRRLKLTGKSLQKKDVEQNKINSKQNKPQSKTSNNTNEPKKLQQSYQINMQKQTNIEGKQKERIQRFKRVKQMSINDGDIKNKDGQAINRLIDKNYVSSQYKLKVFPLKSHYLIVNLQNRSNKKGLFYVKITDNDYQSYKGTYPQPQLKIITDFHSQINPQDKDRILSIQANKEKLLKYKKLNANFQVELQQKEKLSVVCQYFTYRAYISQKNLQSGNNIEQMMKTYNHCHTVTVSLLQAVSQSIVSSISKIHIIPQAQQSLIKIEQIIKKQSKNIIPFPFIFSSLVTDKYDIYMNENKCSIIYQDLQSNQEDEQRQFKSTGVSEARQRFNRSQGHQKTFYLESPKGLLDSINNNLLFSPKGQVMPSPKGKMTDFIDENRIQQLSKKKVLQNVSIFGQKVTKGREQQIKSTMRKTRDLNVSASKNYQSKRDKYINYMSIFVPPQYDDKNIINGGQHSILNTEDNYGMSKSTISIFLVPKNNIHTVQGMNLQLTIQQVDQQEVMKLPLFEPVKSTLKIPHNFITSVNGRKPKTIGLVSSHPEFKPYFQWIEIDYQNKSHTEVTFNYTSTIYGHTSFHLILIDPLQYSNFYNTLIGQSEADFQLLTKSYLNKILFNIITPFPSLKAQLTINLPYNQSYVNEPFLYTNSSQYNTIFHIYTSHPHLISFLQKDKISEIKAKCDKRFSIKINVKGILNEYLNALQSYMESDNLSEINEQNEKDLCPTVVVGMVSDRFVQHFGFQFKFR